VRHGRSSWKADLTNVEQIPERFPTLLVIQKQLHRLLSSFNRCLQSLGSRAIRVIALQKSTIARNNFSPCVTRNADKPIGRINNRIIGLAGNLSTTSPVSERGEYCTPDLSDKSNPLDLGTWRGQSRGL